jgi:ribosomal-protein-alanine acetyltransferase
MARLEQQIFPADAWSQATMWAELACRPRRAYLVAEGHHGGGVDGGGRLLGYAGLDLAGDVADVMTVAVDPRARGRGLGATLLDGLHARARDAGARSVMLEVRADNTSALGLYRTRGYEVVRTRVGYYRDPAGGPAQDALIMRKELDEDG